MKSILVELQCPYCGYKTHKKSEQFIVSQFESKFRNQILQDEFFHHECPCCHKQLSFLHTCLYQDHKHKFIILLEPQPQEQCPEFEEDTQLVKRFVNTINDFKEKILIFEDDLNDLAIECIKWKLRNKLKLSRECLIQYHDYDLESNTLWFEIEETETKLVAISKSYYDNLENKIPKIKNEKKFKIIDANSVKEFVDFC